MSYNLVNRIGSTTTTYVQTSTKLQRFPWQYPAFFFPLGERLKRFRRNNVKYTSKIPRNLYCTHSTTIIQKLDTSPGENQPTVLRLRMNFQYRGNSRTNTMNVIDFSWHQLTKEQGSSGDIPRYPQFHNARALYEESNICITASGLKIARKRAHEA